MNPSDESWLFPPSKPKFHPLRSESWALRTRVLQFGPMPLLMAIVNVTPDSFSDGGKYFSHQSAVDRILELEDAGADILDIGGESTRPYSEQVDTESELRRVVPVLEAIQGRVNIPVSIDTSKSEVAKAAISLGAEIINDVTGFERDARMPEVAKNAGAGICVMHMQGSPQTMQDAPNYSDVTREICDYLRDRCRSLIEFGIQPDRICIDPGIGFGKTHEHNLQLIRSIDKFHPLNRPLLVGHSRKGFIAKVLQDKNCPRVSGTLGVSLALMRTGAQILRVHDVIEHRQAMLLFAASGGLEEG